MQREEECVQREEGCGDLEAEEEVGCVEGDEGCRELEPEVVVQLEDGDLGREETVGNESEGESSEVTDDAGIGGESVTEPVPTRDLGSNTPAEVFQELLIPEIADDILLETNRYADQYVDSHSNYLEVHPRARAHDFIRSPFSIVELYK